MTRMRDISAAACGLFLAVLCAGVAGCDRAAMRSPEEQAAPAPAPDVQSAEKTPDSGEAYQAQLRETIAERKKVSDMLVRVNARLRAMEERARAALPSNATPEQVRAELDSNPRKYPAYRPLLNAQAQCQTSLRDFSRAQKLIRENKSRKTTPAR